MALAEERARRADVALFPLDHGDRASGMDGRVLPMVLVRVPLEIAAEPEEIPCAASIRSLA